MTRAASPKPDWLGAPSPDHPPDGGNGATAVADALEDEWAEHQQARDVDEPRAEEMPGGVVWQAIYEEATAAAGGDPRDLWNRLSEDERGRYCTLAAVQRRQRREHSVERSTASGRNNPLPFVSARELAATTSPEVPWLVRHYLARGALTEIDGRAKRAGKTTFLGHLFAAVLHGHEFLGQPTSRTPIVLLSEMHDTPLRQLLERTGLLDEDELRILRWAETRLVRWPDVVADAIAECREYGARLLVVDTLPQWAGIRGDQENDAGAALAAIEPLQAAAAEGLCVGLVRHERKGGGDVGESGRGSTAFTGAVDIVVRLAMPLNPPRETVRQVSVLSRFDGAPPELMIELTDHGYEVLGEETAVVFAQARNDLRDLLPDAPHGLAMPEILAALGDGARRTTVSSALDALINAGQVQRTGAGRKGSPHLWSRVPVDGVSVSVGGSPPKGGTPPPTERNRNAGHSASSVGARMAEILDEPEDLDEPDDLGSLTRSLFGDQPEALA